jgi:phage gp36-like protein
MYCSVDDLLARYSEDVLIDITTDGTVDDTEINQAKVDGTIADVSALIDSYLQKEYNVPLSPVPRVISKISVDIVLYELFSDRGIDEDSEQDIIRKYKNAIRLLEKIAEGKVTLGSSTPPPDNGLEVVSQVRVFSRDSLKGF